MKNRLIPRGGGLSLGSGWSHRDHDSLAAPFIAWVRRAFFGYWPWYAVNTQLKNAADAGALAGAGGLSLSESIVGGQTVYKPNWLNGTAEPKKRSHKIPPTTTLSPSLQLIP